MYLKAIRSSAAMAKHCFAMRCNRRRTVHVVQANRCPVCLPRKSSPLPSMYSFRALVVCLSGVSIHCNPVCQLSSSSDRFSGKSWPRCTVQPMCFEFGYGLNRRAPSTANVPAPPIMFCEDGFGGACRMSSIMSMPNVQKSILACESEVQYLKQCC